MPDVRVIDTNVVIGLTIKHDRHHATARAYTVGYDSTVYLPPTAKEEFEDLESDIRQELSVQITAHQEDVIETFDEGRLQRRHLNHARNALLAEGDDITPALRGYYDNLKSTRPQPYRQEIVEDLNIMSIEVWEDASEDMGGWNSVVDIWTGGIDTYDGLKSQLLINSSENDCQICVEAHHIALHNRGECEFGTADSDFIDHKSGEPWPREVDILELTEIDRIEDLRS